MKKNKDAETWKRLILKLLEKIDDEEALREIYLFLNRIVCRGGGKQDHLLVEGLNQIDRQRGG